MVDLQKQINRLEDANIQLAGISYDAVDILKTFAAENSITFPLLSDFKDGQRSETIKRFQLLDTRESGKYSGVPVPTTVVIDRQKKVRLILRGEVKKRHSVDELIAQVRELGND